MVTGSNLCEATCALIFKITEYSVSLADLAGLHEDIAQCKSKEPRAGCKMDGEGRRGSATGTIQKRDG